MYGCFWEELPIVIIENRHSVVAERFSLSRKTAVNILLEFL